MKAGYNKSIKLPTCAKRSPQSPSLTHGIRPRHRDTEKKPTPGIAPKGTEEERKIRLMNQTATKKTRSKASATTILLIVLLAIAAVILVISIISSFGIVGRLNTVAETKNYSLNANQLQVLKYQDAYQSLYYNCLYYSYGMSSYANDIWGDLATYKGYPDLYAIVHVSSYMEATNDNVAFDTAERVLVYCEGAKAANMTLTEAERAEAVKNIACINMETLQACADSIGSSLSTYLKSYIGNGVSKGDVEEVLELYALANAYAEKKSEELLDSVTPEEAEKYREEHKDEFYTAKYVSYVLQNKDWQEEAEKCTSVDELKKLIAEKLVDDGFKDAYKKQFTDAKVEDTAGEAKTKETVLASILYRAELSEDKTSFDAAWDEEDSSVTLEGYDKAGDLLVKSIYTTVKTQYGKINEEASAAYVTGDSATEIQKWLFDKARKENDVDVIKTTATTTGSDGKETTTETYTWCFIPDMDQVMTYDREKTKNGFYVELKDDTASETATGDSTTTLLTKDEKYKLIQDAADLDARKTVFTGKLGTYERTGLTEKSLKTTGEELAKWFYSEDRKEGDYDKITVGEGDDAKTYAVLFVEENEETWLENAKSAVSGEKMEAWYEDFKKECSFQMDYTPETVAETEAATA